MKIRLDLTKTNRFAVWESGGWDASKKPPFGNAIIVAGPDGEKLKIAFDVNPRENITQCAFFAEIGQTLASCYITCTDDGKRNVTLELARIQALTTELVQGEAQPTPKLQTLWVHREVVGEDVENADLPLNYDIRKDGQRQEYQNLLWVAIQKALTPSNEQKFFWAIPRTSN
jgi:hypothetical protein